MAESVRALLVEIMILRRGQYERVMASGEGESLEVKERYRLLYLEARLDLARYDAEPMEGAGG